MCRNSEHLACFRGSGSRLRKFAGDEEGSYSIEAVIWMPIFAILLALIMNVSVVFFTESQMMRVVQDGNRAFSLGRLTSEQAVEDYVLTTLAYTDADIVVTTTVSGGIIRTQLSAPATDLMPLNFLRDSFSNVRVGFTAQQIVEF